MKTILTAICIFISCLCFGQTDSNYYKGITFGDSSLSEIGGWQAEIKWHRMGYSEGFDTVPIIILYSDTADCIGLMMATKVSIEPAKWDTVSTYKMEWVLWKPGWQVLERKNTTYCFNCGPYWEHREYLDENKKRLTENFVVWQVLKRKLQKQK